MEYRQIKTRHENGVLMIVLNRPERLNAWTEQMENEVHHAITIASRHNEVRCAVITGEGRGFCAGADTDGLHQTALGETIEVTKDAILVEESHDAIRKKFPGRFGYFYATPFPIIAMINGPCAGIGLILSLFADMRYAADEAKFTTAFAQRGLIAEHGVSWLLPRLVGEAHAMDLLLTARKFLGSEAAQIGLVNASMPIEELKPCVSEIASHLATQVSPRSVKIMKRQIREAYSQTFGEALEVADHEMCASFESFDFQEGVASFVERRKPEFKGN